MRVIVNLTAEICKAGVAFEKFRVIAEVILSVDCRDRWEQTVGVAIFYFRYLA